MVELKDIVNLDIYPIDQQDCDEYKKIVNPAKMIKPN